MSFFSYFLCILIFPTKRTKMEVDNGDFRLDTPIESGVAPLDDPGSAYQDGFSSNNHPPFSVDQPSHQHHALDPANFNLLNLFNMPNPSIFNHGGPPPPPGFGLLGVDIHNAADSLPFHVNLPPQQPPSLFQVDHGAYGYGDYGDAGKDDEVFEFAQKRGGGSTETLIRCPKNFVTERQRRQTFNDKFQHLRSLVPKPNKNDRASIVEDAINYIKELKRTVNELKILVEKKRCLKQRLKRNRSTMEDEEATVINSCDPDKPTAIKSEAAANNHDTLRSSWLERKYKDTEIDVRIVDDEVTIKLVQRKKMINCLVYFCRSLDELQLDLQHVTGGNVGDYYSFLFNTKILEGSSVYASAIANKLVEVADVVIPSAAAATYQ